MKRLARIIVAVVTLSTPALAQQSEAWKIHGFVEEQYRPKQDFSASSLWLTTKKENSDIGIFNFSQTANPAVPTKINWWQTYTGVYAGKATKIGFIEGGLAGGVEQGNHLRLAGYGFVAPKRGGISLFVIHEQGLYKGSAWTRLHLMKSFHKNLKLGYHYQTYFGNGINADIKIPKTPFSVFVAVTGEHGQIKSMLAFRCNF